MSDKEKQEQAVEAEKDQTQTGETQGGEPQAEAEPKAPETPDPLAQAQEALKASQDQMLRLAAEYDNFRKRSQKEKDSAYSNGKADAALAFLPVFDNLQRALAQPSEDAAYVKGVEMTMTQLRGVLEKLGITEIEVAGQPFDPNVANAVMHVEDENLGENVVAEVFQSGFRMGDKVIRFAMVKVAN